MLSRTAGPRDNGSLEARKDVLTFTGPPLTEPLDVLGPITALLRVSTDTGHADVFARLCDVDERGRSVNICDGLVRLRTAGQESSEAAVPMSATAHRFAARPPDPPADQWGSASALRPKPRHGGAVGRCRRSRAGAHHAPRRFGIAASSHCR
ncbi:hypothetical protein GCM10020000_07450 [Streptomyces olivoverticillatus]